MQHTAKILLASIVVPALLAGCGGGGSHSSGSSSGGSTDTGGSTPLGVSGGATLLSKTSDSEIVATDSPATHLFGDTPAVVPAGVAVPAGSKVAIVASSTPVLNITGTGGFTVDGHATGVSFGNGKLATNVALPPSAMTQLSASAPSTGFFIGARAGGLTIRQAVQISGPVLSDGTAGIPTSVGGNVPSNGSSSAGVVVNVGYPAAFAGYSAKLLINWKVSGVAFTMTQTKTVAADGTVKFSPASGGKIPTSGIDVLSLSLAAK